MILDLKETYMESKLTILYKFTFVNMYKSIYLDIKLDKVKNSQQMARFCS